MATTPGFKASFFTSVLRRVLMGNLTATFWRPWKKAGEGKLSHVVEVEVCCIWMLWGESLVEATLHIFFWCSESLQKPKFHLQRNRSLTCPFSRYRRSTNGFSSQSSLIAKLVSIGTSPRMSQVYSYFCPQSHPKFEMSWVGSPCNLCLGNYLTSGISNKGKGDIHHLPSRPFCASYPWLSVF